MGNTIARFSANNNGGLLQTTLSPIQRLLRTATFRTSSSPSENNTTRPRVALIVELYFMNTSTEPTPAHTTTTIDLTSGEVREGSPQDEESLELEPEQSSQSSETTANNDRDNFRGRRPVRRIVLLLNEEVAARVLNGNAEQEITNILNHILSLNGGNKGIPPTSQKILDNLPLIIVTRKLVDTYGRCSVCCEDFIEGNEAVQLPCDHAFDKNCLIPWLSQHSSCPLCRYELPVDDPEYEKDRKLRMSGRINIEEEDSFLEKSSQETEGSSQIPESKSEMEVPLISSDKSEISDTSLDAPRVEESISLISDKSEEESLPTTQMEQSSGDLEGENEEIHYHRESVTSARFGGREKRREERTYFNKLKRWLFANKNRK